MRWMDAATGKKEGRLNRIWISFNATKAAQKKNDAKSATDRRTYTPLRRLGCGCDITFFASGRVTKVSEEGPTFDVKQRRIQIANE